MLYWRNVSPTHSYARIVHTQFVVVVLVSYLVERGDDLMMVSNRLIGVMVAALLTVPFFLFSLLTLTHGLFICSLLSFTMLTVFLLHLLIPS